MELLLGVDIGFTSIKANIYDIEGIPVCLLILPNISPPSCPIIESSIEAILLPFFYLLFSIAVFLIL